MTTKTDILAFSENAIAFRPMFARIAGGVTSGLFLSQLFYWTGKGSRSDGWIWKSYTEWNEETCLTRSEIDRARRDLEKIGVLEELLRGVPATLHYRLNLERLGELIEQDMETQRAKAESADAKSSEPDCRIVQTDCRIVQSNTETTTENTTETPDATHRVADATPTSFPSWLSLIREKRNRVAVLVRMYAALYPDHDPPDYGYMGKAARAVGGASNLARLLWEASVRPPVGDVLAYVLQVHRGQAKRGNNRRNGSGDEPTLADFEAIAYGGRTS